MKEFKRLTKGAVLAAAILFCAGTSRAAVTACGSGTAHSANLGTTGNGLNGTAAAVNTPPQGCGLDDLGFNTFVVNQTGTGNVTGPAEGTIDPATSGGGFTGGQTGVNPIGLNLGSATTAIFTSGTTTTTANTLDETVGFIVTPNLGGAAEEPASGQWAIDGVNAMSIAGAAIAGTDIPTGANAPSIKITQLVCIGQTSTANCATSNEATVTLTVTYSGTGTTLDAAVTSASCGSVSASLGCALSGTNGVNGITFDPTLSLAVVDTISITAPADTLAGHNYTLDFDNFTDPYLQEGVPEPSTFVLLGSALAGLGALRLRKRNQA